MLRNYAMMAVRRLARRWIFETVNLTGLAVGFASTLLIILYVHHEWNYDVFHTDVDRIYRVQTISEDANQRTVMATVPDALPNVLRDTYPEITALTFLESEPYWVAHGADVFKETVHIADASFFSFFSFPMVVGDGASSLRDPNAILLSATTARKYFGTDNPIGEVMLLGQHVPFTVQGVFADMPTNSTIQANMVVAVSAMERLQPGYEAAWWSIGRYTFVKLRPDASPNQLAEQFPALAERHLPDFMQGHTQFGLVPLREVHLQEDVRNEMVPPVRKGLLFALLGIAIAILGIAGINFMNLTTARHTERAREVGLRRMLGAQRYQLVGQFIGESVILTGIAILVGIALAEMLLPLMLGLTGIPLQIPYAELGFWLGIAGSSLVVGWVAGLYPAVFLSAYRPLDSMHGLRRGGAGGIRRGLVTVQFGLSTTLIICTLVMVAQVRFMKQADLGFTTEPLLVVPTQQAAYDQATGRLAEWANMLRAQGPTQGITGWTFSENVPGAAYPNRFGVYGTSGEPAIEMVVTSIDTAFIETYGMELREGRTFDPAMGTDVYSAVLLNETAQHMLGWDTAVDKTIRFAHDNRPLQVIGVVRDIHFASLQATIAPQVYRYVAPYAMGYLTARLAPSAPETAVAYLETTWYTAIGAVPFSYHFMQTRLDEHYRQEEKAIQMVAIFAGLAILLACVGLLALVALGVSQRAKEIGIRKVFGASSRHILALLARTFGHPLTWGIVLAVPISVILMKQWLANFAYTVSWTLEPFVGAAMLVGAAALLATGYQAMRAIRMDPVRLLRHE